MLYENYFDASLLFFVYIYMLLNSLITRLIMYKNCFITQKSETKY